MLVKRSVLNLLSVHGGMSGELGRTATPRMIGADDPWGRPAESSGRFFVLQVNGILLT